MPGSSSPSSGTVSISYRTDRSLATSADTRAKRYKVRFPSRDAYFAAQAAELPTVYRPAVESAKRCFIGVDVPIDHANLASAARNEAATLTLFEREFGARVVEDFRYDMETAELFEMAAFRPEETAHASLDEVLGLIRAPECWGEVRGRGVAIAVVDTGIDGSRPEFPAWKRVGGWAPLGEDPWTDWRGHGTMCATIAAGTRADGGVFDGVAPAAGVIACRTRFFDTELADIYDQLTARAVNEGTTVVASNSFGIRTGSPPPRPEDSDFLPALDEAIRAGVRVFFSAGNYHEMAGGAHGACSPTSIWLHKCRSDVMAVATCKLDGSMWSYSSRGPGQHHGEPDCSAKPDVMAPTPAFGRIVYGSDVVVLENGWGTSGACPQVAGLAALLLQRHPGLGHAEVFDAIRGTARPVGHGPSCEGAGIIDCRAALDAV